MKESEDETDSKSWWPSSSKTQESQKTSEKIPFDQVTPDPSITKPKKNQVILVLRTEGHKTPRTIQMQLTHICDWETYLKHKVNVQIILDIPEGTKHVMFAYI